MHLLLLVYSLCSIFSKNAAHEPFLSLMFILLYLRNARYSFIYAVGWQQILKRLSLSMAFANKANHGDRGMVWGFFIGSLFPPLKILGAAMVIVGVVLYARADGKEEKPGDRSMATSGRPMRWGTLRPRR